MARVVSINVGLKKGTKKTPVAEAVLTADVGIENDAHAAFGHRQVSLLSFEDIRAAGLSCGDFAENITTEALDLSKVRIGDRIRVGEGVLLEVSQIGKECHTRCAIYNEAGECIMPKKGVFTRVIEGGRISAGDEMVLI